MLNNSEGIQEEPSLHLLLQLLVTCNSKRKDGAGASGMAYGLVSVLYGPKPQPKTNFYNINIHLQRRVVNLLD